MGMWDSFLDRFRTPYDLQDLLAASAEVLGSGTYGRTFKVSMDSGQAVVVKRLKGNFDVSEKEFKATMEEIGRLDHKNLVPLRASFFGSDGRNEKLLIHDYFPLGSLSAVLHGDKTQSKSSALNWETRAKIALGTARGVQHIHSQGPTTCHGNIKSSNILISKNYEARVSDFGLAQMGRLLNPSYGNTSFYLAPEASVSQKADVYSFGVLLLELLTGKTATRAAAQGRVSRNTFTEAVDLPLWIASKRIEEVGFSEVFDLELLRDENAPEDLMLKLLRFAVECTAPSPDDRPTMADATARIEGIISGRTRTT